MHNCPMSRVPSYDMHGVSACTVFAPYLQEFHGSGVGSHQRLSNFAAVLRNETSGATVSVGVSPRFQQLFTYSLHCCGCLFALR